MTSRKCRTPEQEIYDELMKELFDGVREIDESELVFDEGDAKEAACYFDVTEEERQAMHDADKRKLHEILRLKNLLHRLNNMIYREKQDGDPLRLDLVYRMLEMMLGLGQSIQLALINSRFGKRRPVTCGKILRDLTALLLPIDQLR